MADPPWCPMCAAPETGATGSAIRETVAELERRLHQERDARSAAERLLKKKHRELSGVLARADQAQRHLELVLQASSGGLWEWEAAGDTVRLLAFASSDGGDRELPMSFAQAVEGIHPDDRAALTAEWQAHLRGESSLCDMRLRAKAGQDRWQWLHLLGQAVERDAQGRALRVAGTVRDITPQRRAEDSLRLLAHAFANARDAMLVLTPQWDIVESNRAFALLAGLGDAAPASMNLGEFVNVSEFDPGPGEAAGWYRETRLHTRRGRGVPVHVSITRFEQGGGEPEFRVMTLRDISDKHSAERQLERLAWFDPLTGLPNRTRFESDLKARMATPAAPPFAMLFVDLDDFKAINDTLGHTAGDKLLTEVARRIVAAAGGGSYAARWGGDEFAVLVDGPDPVEVATQTSRRLIEAVGGPGRIGEVVVRVTPSIGIATYPADARDADTLMRQADTAMYEAKRAGRCRFQFHQRKLDDAALRRLALTAQLRTDLEADGLDFVCQSKVDRSGALVGHELLARWQTQQYGPISPGEFIALAEDIGLIGRLGAIAIDRAAGFAASLHARGWTTPVAVNLSSRQVLEPQTEQMLADACQRHAIPAAMLEVEVTESVFLEDMEATRAFLQRLHAQGYGLALDDFGTGFSALGYLRALPFQTIKIDRSFVRDIHRDERARRLLAGMVELGHALGMQVVAEGVETREQRAILSALEIDQMQGFLFHRPAPLPEVLAMLEARSRGGA